MEPDKKKTSFISKYGYLQILFVASIIILHISWKTWWFNLVGNRILSKQFRHPLGNAMVHVRNMGHLNWSRNFKSYKIASVDWISPVVWRHWFQLRAPPTILTLNSVNEQPTMHICFGFIVFRCALRSLLSSTSFAFSRCMFLCCMLLFFFLVSLSLSYVGPSTLGRVYRACWSHDIETPSV